MQGLNWIQQKRNQSIKYEWDFLYVRPTEFNAISSEEIESTHLWCIPWNSNLDAGTVQVQPNVTKFAEILSQKLRKMGRGVYLQKSNPLLFAGLSLPRTKIRPKHRERLVWAQNKVHFLTQHSWRQTLVWLYI